MGDSPRKALDYYTTGQAAGPTTNAVCARTREHVYVCTVLDSPQHSEWQRLAPIQPKGHAAPSTHRRRFSSGQKLGCCMAGVGMLRRVGYPVT